MIINDKDITEKDFINIIKPFENNFKKYINIYNAKWFYLKGKVLLKYNARNCNHNI